MLRVGHDHAKRKNNNNNLTISLSLRRALINKSKAESIMNINMIWVKSVLIFFIYCVALYPSEKSDMKLVLLSAGHFGFQTAGKFEKST